MAEDGGGWQNISWLHLFASPFPVAWSGTSLGFTSSLLVERSGRAEQKRGIAEDGGGSIK